MDKTENAAPCVLIENGVAVVPPQARSVATGRDGLILRSAAKGQEFVLDGAAYPQAEAWQAGLVGANS